MLQAEFCSNGIYLDNAYLNIYEKNGKLQWRAGILNEQGYVKSVPDDAAYIGTPVPIGGFTIMQIKETMELLLDIKNVKM